MYCISNPTAKDWKQRDKKAAPVLRSFILGIFHLVKDVFPHSRKAHHVPHRLFELHKWTPTGDSADTTCCTVAGTAGTERTRCSCLVPQGGSKLGSVLEPKGWNTMELIATSKRYVCPKNTHHTSYPTHFVLTNHMPYARKLFSRVDTIASTRYWNLKWYKPCIAALFIYSQRANYTYIPYSHFLRCIYLYIISIYVNIYLYVYTL